MARDLEVQVIVESAAAKTALAEIDQSFDKAADSARNYAAAQQTVETRSASGKDAISRLLQEQIKSVAAQNSAAEATRLAAQELNTFTVTAKEVEAVTAANTTGMELLRGGLADVAEGAGLTVAQLGLMGTVGAVLGTAMASWKLTRVAMEFFGLDEAVTKVYQSLLGFESVEKQTAAAMDDSIRLAERRGYALDTIADKESKYHVALILNKEAAEEETRVKLRQIDSEKLWQAELDKHAALLPELKRQLELHVLTVETLSKNYGLSKDAIALYRHELQEANSLEQRIAADRKKVETETNRAWAEQIRWIGEMNKETARLVDEQDKRRLEVNKAITKEFEAQVAALAKQANSQVIDEFNAKKGNQAAKGYDVAGNALGTPGAIGSPFDVLNRTLADLEKQRAQGVQTLEREEQAWRKYDEAMAKANTSVDQSTGAHGRAAGAGDAVTAAHNRAAAAAEGAAAAMGKFASGVGYQVPTGESLDRAGIPQSTITQGWVGNGGPIPFGGARAPLPWGGARDSGGPVSAGTAYYVGKGAQPELFVPSSDGTMTPNGSGGVSIGAVHVHGNVESQAVAERLAQRTADLLYQKMRGGQGKMTIGRA